MGVEVAVRGASEAELTEVRALFAERDCVFSRFRADSELTRVNRAAGSAVVVSPLFARMLRTALAAASRTGGLVDPTLGGALEAAGYDRDFDRLEDDPRPCGPAVPGARGLVRLDGRLLRRPPGLRLDLNGVVKAATVDDALGCCDGRGSSRPGATSPFGAPPTSACRAARRFVSSRAGSPRAEPPSGRGAGAASSSTT